MSKQLETPVDIHTVVSRDPEIHSGDLVFAGTRVPVTVLIDNLKAGSSISDFVQGYPTVERWQIEAYLDLSANTIDQARLRGARSS